MYRRGEYSRSGRRKPARKKETFRAYLMAALLVTWGTSLVFTITNLGAWIVESMGTWTQGQIVSIHHCTSRSIELSTLALEISYPTGDGAQREGEASCESTPHSVGETVVIRYLPIFPWRVMTREDIGDGHGGWLLLSLAISGVTTAFLWRNIARDTAELKALRNTRLQTRAQLPVNRRHNIALRAAQRRRARNRR